MLKIGSAIICLLFSSIAAFAQIEKPVTWEFSAKKIADKKYEIHLTATIQDKWHLYAQEAGDGPVSTSFSFSKNPLIKLDGKVIELGKAKFAFDKNFDSKLKFYENRVDFVQKVSLKTKVNTILKGTLNFMVCNDQKCLPPSDVPFSVKIEDK